MRWVRLGVGGLLSAAATIFEKSGSQRPVSAAFTASRTNGLSLSGTRAARQSPCPLQPSTCGSRALISRETWCHPQIRTPHGTRVSHTLQAFLSHHLAMASPRGFTAPPTRPRSFLSGRCRDLLVAQTSILEAQPWRWKGAG